MKSSLGAIPAYRAASRFSGRATVASSPAILASRSSAPARATRTAEHSAPAITCLPQHLAPVVDARGPGPARPPGRRYTSTTESGLFRNANAIYQLVHRTLSGTHGAHPTHRLLDTYIQTGRMFGRVLPQSRTTPLRRGFLQMSLVLTGIHGIFAPAERGCRTDELADVANALRLPGDAFESTGQPAAQQERRT